MSPTPPGVRVDNSADFPGPGARTWHPARAIGPVAGVVMAAALGWATLSGGTDRLVAGTLLLVAGGVLAFAVRRRVTAGPAGVAVRGLVSTRRWLWSDVDAIALATQQRLGLTTTAVELDLGDELIVLGRIDLDDDPESVHQALLRWYAS